MAAKCPEALGRFQREARAASALNHPRICTIHDLGEEGGRYFIVMEFLDGQTLKQRIADGPLPIYLVFEVAAQICDALDAAHKAGIIHRDVKPGNIFINNDDQVKVLDFGLAKLLQPQTLQAISCSDSTASLEESLSATGAVVGTLPYMSPEQIRGERLDLRSDLFSFGSLLYEMATGARAFPAASCGAVIGEILHGTPKPSILFAGRPSGRNKHLEQSPK